MLRDVVLAGFLGGRRSTVDSTFDEKQESRIMKYVLAIILALPLLAFAAEHGGQPAASKEHGGQPAESKEHGGEAAESKEHGGEPAESKEHGGEAAETHAEHAGAPAEEAP